MAGKRFLSENTVPEGHDFSVQLYGLVLNCQSGLEGPQIIFWDSYGAIDILRIRVCAKRPPQQKMATIS